MYAELSRSFLRRMGRAGEVGFDNGAYHNHSIKSYYCFPGTTTLKRSGPPDDLLGGNRN